MNGRCPHCARGKLFKGFLDTKEACEVCGLDYGFADSGDGPAFFVMSITGIFAVAIVFILVFGFGMVAGGALLIGFAFTMAFSFAILRPAKGLMIGLQYKNDAQEGRLK